MRTTKAERDGCRGTRLQDMGALHSPMRTAYEFMHRLCEDVERVCERVAELEEALRRIGCNYKTHDCADYARINPGWKRESHWCERCRALDQPDAQDQSRRYQLNRDRLREAIMRCALLIHDGLAGLRMDDLMAPMLLRGVAMSAREIEKLAEALRTELEQPTTPAPTSETPKDGG